MFANGFVQVDAAHRAKAFTVGAANRFDGQFQQKIVAGERCKIDVPIIGNDQFGFHVAAETERKQLGIMSMQGLSEFFQTTHTFLNQKTGKVCLHQQPLWGAADVSAAIELGDLKIGR